MPDNAPQRWSPQPGPQLEAIQATWCDELFFGGARGGGKSDYLLGDFGRDVDTYGVYWRGVLFRATYPELEELISRGRQIFPATFPGAKYHEQSRTFQFPSGASLKMRYLERDADADAYLGHQYTWIGWDELAKRSRAYAYNALKACLRSAAPIPDKRIRATGNPGGAGHQWVKQYFGIDKNPFGSTPIDDAETGMTRMFIRSRVQDNIILLQNDPRYVARLKGVGSKALVKAWLDGDWDAVAGAFFDGWSFERHVLRAVPVPSLWARFVSFDYGYAAPFSVGWWAVASDDWRHPDGALIPRGAMVRYREWYGCTETPNTGIRLHAEQIAKGIKGREGEETIAARVADPAIFSSPPEGAGPTIAERMAGEGIHFNRGDNARVRRAGALGGWDQVRARLDGRTVRDEAGTVIEQGPPAIFCFDTCSDSIRTIPSLQHDTLNPEDLDTDGEDHAADEWRYACMSRPWIREAPIENQKRDRYRKDRARGSSWAA